VVEETKDLSVWKLPLRISVVCIIRLVFVKVDMSFLAISSVKRDKAEKLHRLNQTLDLPNTTIKSIRRKSKFWQENIGYRETETKKNATVYCKG